MCDYCQKKSIFFLLLFFFSFSCFLLSQNDEWYKSLEKKENETKLYSEKLSIQCELAAEMAEFDNGKAMKLAQKCLKEAKINKFEFVEAKSLYIIAEILRIKGRSYEAFSYNEKALITFEKLKNTLYIFNTKRDLGVTNSNISKFNTAHNLLQVAIKGYEENQLTNTRDYALAINYFALNLLRQGEYQKAIFNISKAEKLFEKINDNKNKARIKNNLGLIKKNMGLLYNALKNYLSSLEENEKTNPIHRNTIIVLINLGNLYMHKKDTSNYENSFRYYQKAYKIATTIQDTIQMSFALEALAKYNITLKKYTETKKYYWQGFNLIKNTQNYIEEGYYLMRIADFYSVIKEYNESIKIINQAIALFKKNKNQEALSQGFAKMSIVYHNEKKYQLSQDIAFKALETAKQSDFKNIPYLYPIIFNNYVSLGEYQKAENWGNQTIQYFKSVKANQNLLEMYRKLYVLDTTRKNYQKAILWLNEYEIIKDSISIYEKNNEVSELQTKYNTQEQDKQNIYLRKINYLSEQQLKQIRIAISIVIFVLFLVAIIVVILILQRRKMKKILSILNKKNDEITEKNKALEELNEVKSRVFSLVSHDMRGPLGNLKAVLSLIEGGHLSKEEEKDIFQQLNTDVERTYDFLQNLLVWAKSQMEGFAPIFVQVELRKVVKKVFYIVEAQADKKSIKLRNQIEKDIFVNSDEDVLNVILLNLISNAIKFTHTKGEIIITNIIESGKVKIAIRDNGVGIVEEHQSKIFGDVKFTTQGTNNEKGTGFGLSMCRDFVKILGGDIWFESVENKGTIFYFTLPLSNSN